jgi:hypothetical protein
VDDEPTTAAMVRVKSRISAETWRQRVEQARRDEVLIRKILAAEIRGFSLERGDRESVAEASAELGAATPPGLPQARARGVDRCADTA